MKIIFDIDGTLSDCRHRRHFVTDGKHDWKSFNESMVMDYPIIPIVQLHEMIARFELSSNVKFVTGRQESYRPHTKEWLEENLNLDGFEITEHNLKMRKTDDFRPDHEIKEEILMELKADGWWPDLVIDDRESVCKMWRSHDIICLQNSMKELP